jgi:hypothetical protein
MLKLLWNWLLDCSKLVILVDYSDKYNFKNAKLHLTTCKNIRSSYIL